MAKRFTDTDKYKKPFIRGLRGAYKLLWDYLYHECDHAGIWIVDFEIAQIYLGSDMPVNKKDALKYFNLGENRVIEVNGNKWFLPSFIEFQYGELNPENRAHNSVLTILQIENENTGELEPCTVIDLHEYFKAKYNPVIVRYHGLRIIKSGSTTKLNDREFINEYLERIYVYLSELSIEVSTYNEWVDRVSNGETCKELL